MTGAELKRWRRNVLGISQGDLGLKLGKAKRTVQLWEAAEEVPLMVRFALAALANRLEPLGGWD